MLTPKYIKVNDLRENYINRQFRAIVCLIGSKYENKSDGKKQAPIRRGEKYIVKYVRENFGIKMSPNEIKKLYKFLNNSKDNIYLKFPRSARFILKSIINISKSDGGDKRILKTIVNTANTKDIPNNERKYKEFTMGKYCEEITNKNSKLSDKEKKIMSDLENENKSYI